MDICTTPYQRLQEFTRKPSAHAQLTNEYLLETVPPIGRPRTNTARRTLHEAACDNDYKCVNDILTEAIASRMLPKIINAFDEHGFAPIHYAAKFNCFRILRLLVEKGADPSIETEDDRLTPLHFAAYYQPRFIYSSGDDPQESITARSPSVTEERNSPSILAVRYLISKLEPRTKVNAFTRHGSTPLHMACQHKNIGAVTELIKSEHIDLVPKDASEKNTPLHEACKHGDTKIVEMILDKLQQERKKEKDWLLTNKGRQTPLHLACREGHAATVSLLLEKVSKDCKKKLFETRDNDDMSPLDLACAKGNDEIVNCLLKHKASLEDCGGTKRATPLHIAARLGHKKVVKTLLASDKARDLAMATDIDHQTPVHYAVLSNDREVLEAFKEVDLPKEVATTPDKHSRPPLLLAAKLGKDAAFQMLLEILPPEHHSVLDRDGKSAMCLAAEGDHKSIMKIFTTSPVYHKLLNTPDANIRTPLHLAAKNGHIDTVKYLLSLRNDHESTKEFLVDRNPKDILFHTPMHLAAKYGHANVVSELNDTSGCLPMEEDDNGDTPLHLACTKGHLGVVLVLRPHRGDAGAKNNKDHTPLHCAAIGGHDKIVKSLLVDFHVDVDPVDKNGATPLQLAAHAGHSKVVDRLLQNDADVSKKVVLEGQAAFNALDLAIDGGHEKVAVAIIKSSQWKEALRNKTKSPDSVWGETTPLRKLIRKMPRVAELVLDRCTVPSKTRVDSKEYRIEFNYEFIEDIQDSTSCSSESGIKRDWGPKSYSKVNHPLTLMIEYSRTNLLTHPLVTSLLRLKWNRYGAFTYGIHLFVYSIFVIFLTLFALVVPDPESKTCMPLSPSLLSRSINGDVKTFGTGNCSNQTLECGYCLEPDAVKVVVLESSSIIVGILSVFGFGFYIYLYARLYITYLKDFVTFFNFFLTILAFIFVVVLPSQCYCPFGWQWQLGVMAVFLIWINFTILLRKLPLIGIYVLMFVQIFYTFFKVITLFFLLVIAFSLAFFMAFSIPNITLRHSPFATPARSMVKTITMIVGEFGYEELFNLTSQMAKTDEEVLNPIAHDEVATIIFIIFLVLGPILFLNMLTGLAVDDIKKIQENAALRRLELQIVGVLSIEEIVPNKFRNRFMVVIEDSISPNRGYRQLWELFRHKWWEEESYDTVGSISSVVSERGSNEEQDDDKRHQCTDSVVEDIAMIKRTLQRLGRVMAERDVHRSLKRTDVPSLVQLLHQESDVDLSEQLVPPRPKSGTLEDFFST